MNKKIAFIFMFFTCAAQALYEHYIQQSNILVYVENDFFVDKIDSMLTKFNLKYRYTTSLNNNENNYLYIIIGDASHFHQFVMPKYYIFYQINKLNSRTLPQATFNIFHQAKVVWDSNQNNINQYNNINHHSYLPTDPNYEFLDPVLLPCFLPLKALDSYKQMLHYSNIYHKDISDHIPALFCHCIMQNPSIIIEAGVRWGDGSTVPLKLANELSKAYLIGLDIYDCSSVYASIANSCFLQINDLDFPYYFKTMPLKKDAVDFVFIDTSHLFDHSIKEIAAFISILAKTGALGFHDTNPVGNDPRGVIEALKAYFNLQYDESKYFNHIFEKDNNLWNIIHYPYNNGMTIIKRLEKRA